MLSTFKCMIFASVLCWFVGQSYGIVNQTCSNGDVCINIYECPFFAELLQRVPKPRPASITRMLMNHHCGLTSTNPKNPMVCCSLPISTTTTSTTISSVPLEYQIFEKLNKDRIKQHPHYKVLRSNECGMISVNGKITGGTQVGIEEFPWMALITYSTKNGLEFRCGGTIISDRYVLTAAHCIESASIVGVRLGEFNSSSTKDCEGTYCSPPVQDFLVEDLISHPKYNPTTFQDDIAIIKLATPANFSRSNVKPICLPLDDNSDITGKFAIVSGWGITDNGYKSPVLLKTSIPIVPIFTCQKIYQKFAPVTEKQICAGGFQGRDSCAGDSGGPLKYVELVNGAPRFVQYGIVSYGPRNCGTLNKPGVYTNVAKYMSWILDQLEPPEY